MLRINAATNRSLLRTSVPSLLKNLDNRNIRTPLKFSLT